MSVLTRKEAVVEMIEGAIVALEEQRLACAITLAGAAEGATPLPSAGWHFELFSTPKEEWPEKSQFIALINTSRDWLKHIGTNNDPEIDLGLAPFYVLRALSKYEATYGAEELSEPMHAFQDEWRQFAKGLGDRLRRGFQALSEGLSAFGTLLGRFSAEVRVVSKHPE